MPADTTPLLSVTQVMKSFVARRNRRSAGARVVRALDGVDLTLVGGQSLGLVGESGCGKSTLARSLVRLERPDSGEISLRGTDISTLRGAALKAFRRDVQMVFQDPYTSLDPHQTVFDIIREAWLVHRGLVERRHHRDEAVRLLESVGLDHGALDRRPRQFSGGQRQRIGIARALALRPSVLVLDEPVSALDVSVQAQVIGLLKHLQCDLQFALIFIAHDLSVVQHVCRDVAVMYLGRIIEAGPTDIVFARPRHPYTAALISAVPIPAPASERRRHRITLPGEAAGVSGDPTGCRFRERCWRAQEVCTTADPVLTISDVARTAAACHVPLVDGDHDG